MLSRKNIIATIVALLFVMAVFLIAKVSLETDGNTEEFNRNTLPNLKINTPSPSPVLSPKTFQIDANTDLGKELESVNPKVEDSDFKDL